MSKIPGMTYLEYELARDERRIKRIKENPDPTKPKSNILLFECDRDMRLDQIEALKTGKPFGMINPPSPIMIAMGFHVWDAIRAADRSAGPMARKYFEVIRAEGMAEHVCDRTIVFIPMVLGGDFPKPDFLVPTNGACLPVFFSFLLSAKTFKIPYFNLDRKFLPHRTLEDEEQLKYLTDQLGEMIEYAEAKVPGCKYDEDKLIELLHYSHEYLEYESKIWKLRAATPCPMAPREAFREYVQPHDFPNPAKIVEWARQYYEEMGERVAKGRSGLPDGVEERLRFIWSNTGVFHHDPYTWLGKQGVSIPCAQMSVFDGWRSGREANWLDPWHGRQLKPLEAVARQLDYTWGRLGGPWIDTHLDTCRDLNIDGIVYFNQWGCTVTNNLGGVMSEVAERELGIPTLLLEGRQLDETSWDEKDFLGRLEEFIDIALDAKKKRAQRRQEIGSETQNLS